MSTKGPTGVVSRGDVVWVPYRRNPWPALVQNVYPKKVTYVFFPLPEENGKKWVSFSCNPKGVYALTTTDSLPDNPPEDLLEAYAFAVRYLLDRGLLTGSDTQRKPHEPGSIEIDLQRLDQIVESALLLRTNRKMMQPIIVPTPPSTSTGSSTHRIEKDYSKDDQLDKKPRAKKSSKRHYDEMTSREHNDYNDENILHLGQLRTVIFNKLEDILNDLWTTDRIQNYVTPERDKVGISLISARFLSDRDADALFENIVKYVKSREAHCRLLPAVHLTADVLFPEVIIHSIRELRDISYEDAHDFVRGHNK